MKTTMSVILIALTILIGSFACSNAQEKGAMQTRNLVSSLHKPVFSEFHMHKLFVYCKPNDNVGDPPILYYEPSVEIISVSATTPHITGNFTTYCITFKNARGDCEAFVLSPNQATTSIRLLKLELEPLIALSKGLQ